MKILQIFNRYTDVGGEEIAVEQISRELESQHELRTITFDSQEWLSETSLLSRLKQAFSMAWNSRSIRRVKEDLHTFNPDIILLHNIMPVGSAGLQFYLSRCGIPVVQFVHNFRPFSVNGYCWGKGKLLPQGLRQNYIPEILAGAWQGSRMRTAWYALLIWSNHRLGTYERIHGWIAISNFMRNTFIQGGVEADRIRVISHSWRPQCSQHELDTMEVYSSNPLFLFFGRLTEEKGIRTLLDAWEIFEMKSASGRLVIAGEGPLAEEVRQRCSQMQRASYAGFTTGETKKQLLRECSALVVPSVWWEPLGLVLYEAYDYSKPVLAARSGGIVDHVEDGVTGWLHDPGDCATLAKHLSAALANPEMCRSRGLSGRRLLLEHSTSVWINEFNDFVGGIILAVADRDTSTVVDRKIREVDHGSEIGDGRSQMEGDVLLAHPAPAPLAANGHSGSARTARSAVQQHEPALQISVYLADQNPGYDRSFGISRMSQVVMEALWARGGVEIQTITSKTSQQAPRGIGPSRVLPWGTRRKWVRLLTDHFHPMFLRGDFIPDLHYFPKGYLPLLCGFCRPSVVTIHDTIIQYDEDHYPLWRRSWDYAYWAKMLKHTLKETDRILTVSESSKKQIESFMDRYDIARKPITVTYEPCLYEKIPQPVSPVKKDFVIHLASREPHKRTAQLIRWWLDAEQQGMSLPTLHLIGTLPAESAGLLTSSHTLVKRPFLDDSALRGAYASARALILPSEIEGFGLPALEAYYLGTPVCHVTGTSVGEILSVATTKGRFSLESKESLFIALDEVLAMTPEDIYQCGTKLRAEYSADKVAGRMIRAFKSLSGGALPGRVPPPGEPANDR